MHTKLVNKTVTIHLGSWATLLTLLFIALKLTGQISWSWIWVLCPLWIGVSIGVFFALVTLAIVLGGLLLVVLLSRDAKYIKHS